VREAEGTIVTGPGRSSGSTWSKRPRNYIRNVEAVGSNPITSTKGPSQKAEVGSPEISESTREHYIIGRRARRCELAGFIKSPDHTRIARSSSRWEA
jgi:hypothetical protein